jgi:hypothetical protein
MAAVTGLVLRLGRSLMLSPEGTTNPFAVGALYLVGGAFLLGMATLHLSNYTLRRWLWRAPLFVLAEVAAELLASLVLITLGREPWGTGAADLHDWPTIAGAALLFRSLLVLPFVAGLGGVVQATRAWAARKAGRAPRPPRAGVETGSRK